MAWLQDPELLSALEGIKKKDAELDGKIDEIGKVVGRLGVLATEMNRELKVQEMMAQDRACLSPRLRLLEPCTCTRACLAPSPADIAIRVGTQNTKSRLSAEHNSPEWGLGATAGTRGSTSMAGLEGVQLSAVVARFARHSIVTEGVEKGTEMTEKVNAGIKFAFGQGGGTTKFVTRVSHSQHSVVCSVAWLDGNLLFIQAEHACRRLLSRTRPMPSCWCWSWARVARPSSASAPAHSDRGERRALVVVGGRRPCAALRRTATRMGFFAPRSAGGWLYCQDGN